MARILAPPPPRLARAAAVAVFAALVVSLLAPMAAEAQYRTSFGKNKVQYRDFDWKIYHSPHFDIYYYTEEEHLLEKVVSFAESAYDRLSRRLDFQIQEPTPLIFYATHSAFEQNNIILNFIPEGVGAFATPVRNRMVLPVDLPDPELMNLIEHELTHIFQYHVLFQGSLAKGLASNPPQWLMEGMASYMAKDESTADKMYLRDAVVNDSIPSIAGNQVSGFFAYRFGHATFDFMEDRWGEDGVLDFLYEFRNTIGARADRAIERAFKIDPEDFDREFRQWLRRKYLPQLVATGEPGDFGRRFRIAGQQNIEVSSPVASPSGDLVAALAVYKGDLDVVLFDTKNRRLVKNLTKGLTTSVQYLTAQFLTSARNAGDDLAFSPDGNRVAVFAKRDRGRSLVLVNVLGGGIDRIIDLEVEQPLAPSWSPDGQKILFAGNSGGQFDLFTLDVDSLSVQRLTDDAAYEAGPTFSPDGASVVYSTVVGEYFNLMRMDIATGERFQLTAGEHNDTDPAFSPTGLRVYFTSDRTGVDNIHGLDLETGEISQYTDVVTGCFMPTVLAQPDGKERLVYTGFWKGSFDLYVTDVDEPVEAQPDAEDVPEGPVQIADLPEFEPDILVAVDDANKEKYGGFNFFLENADAFLGVTDDQALVGQAVVTFSDYLGDRRIIGVFDSQNSLSNFDLFYTDLRNRWQWQVHLFDDRIFYVLQDPLRGNLERFDEAYQQTGLQGSVIYPFSLSQRVEFGVGYLLREFTQPQISIDPVTLGPIVDFVTVDDDFPFFTADLVGDSTVFSSFGPIAGHRWRIGATYAPDLDDSGTLFTLFDLDARKYFPITRRTAFAIRLFGQVADGNRPPLLSFGGLDTLRGFQYREIIGDTIAFANFELRFPLIDFLATPIFNFQGIRGRIFLDVGTGYFQDDPTYNFFDSDNDRLEDGLAAYGFGVTVRFYGLNMNWDISRQWDFESSAEQTRSDFYIGTRF